MHATTIRLRFAKRGDLRLVSHHDLMRCLERALRRAGLPVAQTKGFTARPKATFALALALGIEGRHEALDLEFTQPVTPAEVMSRLSAALPAGFDLLEAEETAAGQSPHPVSIRCQLPIPAEQHEAVRVALARFLQSTHWPVDRLRQGRSRTFNLRPFVCEAELCDNGCLRFQLKIDPQGSARAEEFVAALGLAELLDMGAVLVRDDIELANSTIARPIAPSPLTITSEELPPSNEVLPREARASCHPS